MKTRRRCSLWGPRYLTTGMLGLLFFIVAIGCAPAPTTSVEIDLQDSEPSLVHAEDIPRFWDMYDAVQATDDPQEQLRLVNDLYIDRGSPGLHAMNRARSYRSAEYLDAIRNYPQYWASVRANTQRVGEYEAKIAAALEEMCEVYPEGRAVPVYFVIGALRAGGTATDGKLLIGAELAMADTNAVSDELLASLPHLASYFANDPISGLVDLNLHEYVHTQQRTTGGNDLLSQTLFEGVAEYVSTAALGRASAAEAIAYGKSHHEAVIAAFEADIGKEDFSEWIWNSPDNPFGTRDLGYYVGYVIAEDFVRASADSLGAVRRLIELDYLDGAQVASVVDSSGVFAL